jgi:hypothetical protein
VSDPILTLVVASMVIAAVSAMLARVIPDEYDD